MNASPPPDRWAPLRASLTSGVIVGVLLATAIASATVLREDWIAQGLDRLAAATLSDRLIRVPLLAMMGTIAISWLGRVAAGPLPPRRALALLVGAVVLGTPAAISASAAVRPAMRELVFAQSESVGEAGRTALLVLWAAVENGEFVVWLVALGLVAGVRLAGGLSEDRRARIVTGLDRPRLGIAVGIAALLVAGAAAWRGSPAPPSGPDVVVILVDTVRASRLDLYGHDRPTAPHLSAFARDAVWYRNAITPAPWTTPTVAAVLTGRHPSRFGYRDRPVALPPSTSTLAEHLTQAGWHTVGVVSNLYASALAGFDQGFVAWDEEQAQGYHHVSASAVTDAAIAVVEDARARPLFLWVHYFDPHCAYVEHDGIDFVDPGYTGPIVSRMNCLTLYEQRRDWTTTDLAQLTAIYDEELRYTDEHVGRVIASLKAAGRYDDALVVVFADHGEAFAERPDRDLGHGRSLYQELLHVPLLVKWPANAGAGTVVDTPVSLVDLGPTVAAAARVDWPAEPDGVVLRPDTPPPARPLVAETRYEGWLQAVLHDGLKLVRHVESGRIELFDLDADPHERVDLAGDRPETASRLEDLLRDWAEAVQAEATDLDDAVLTGDEVELLRSLGYLDGAPPE